MNLTRLPMPIADNYDWQYDGACNDADPEQFFSPAFERGERRDRREQIAKAYCATCPVVAQCLEFALVTREPFGVWGGLNTTERDDVLARRASTA